MLIIFFILVNAVINTDALKCFSCSYSGVGTVDQRCATDPDSKEENYIIDCQKKYCLSVRMEDINDKNKVLSMVRYCDDTYILKNKIIEDNVFRTYYKVCQTDLCNGGTGRELTANSRDRDDGEPIVLLVPGTSSGNVVYLYSYLICMSILPYFISNLLLH